MYYFAGFTRCHNVNDIGQTRRQNTMQCKRRKKTSLHVKLVHQTCQTAPGIFASTWWHQWCFSAFCFRIFDLWPPLTASILQGAFWCSFYWPRANAAAVRAFSGMRHAHVALLVLAPVFRTCTRTCHLVTWYQLIPLRIRGIGGEMSQRRCSSRSR